ncbi:MAG: sensor histidine kinase [Flavobacteriia bacterium]|jgi:two-component sensor histidine kinase
MHLFKKYILFILITGLSSFGLAQPKFEERNDNISKHQQLRISHLHELIAIDSDSAEVEILKFKKEVENSDLDYYESSNLFIEVLNLEAELYRNSGDYVHMKLAYYQAVSFKNEYTSTYQNLLLQHLSAINEGVKGKYKKQKIILVDLIQKAKQNNFQFLLAKANFTLGKYYANTNNFKAAFKHLDIASKLFEKNGYEIKVYETNVSKGITCFWSQEYQKSLTYFHQTKSFTHKNYFNKAYANSLLNLAEAHLFIEGNQDSAKYYFDAFLKIKDKADIRDIYNCYWSLEELYIQKNNNDSAYHYLKLAYETESKIKDLRREKTNAEIDVLYKKVQNQRKIEDESKHQELLKIIFAFCGIFLILVILVFWFLLNEKGKLNNILATQNDEIMAKNKIIDDSLKEKELLLKEIHHRVKNNLQIISSLLSLQSKNIEDKKAKQAIFEGKERIQAIALIHQKLYLNNSFATIKMNEYLQDLVEQLGKSYSNENNGIQIILKTNDIILNIDTVVPLGLIICELTTNAFKYAFENKSEGKLKVEINHAENGHYILNVKDDGNGMKENFDFLNSKTLGVEIVTALTEQLDGSISYKSDENGTSIKIKFKEINLPK